MDSYHNIDFFLNKWAPPILGIAITLALNIKYNWDIYSLIAFTSLFVWAIYTTVPIIERIFSNGLQKELFQQVISGGFISILVTLLASPYYIVVLLLLKKYNFI